MHGKTKIKFVKDNLYCVRVKMICKCLQYINIKASISCRFVNNAYVHNSYLKRKYNSRICWPRRLTLGYAADRLQESGVRISPGA